MFKSPNFKFKTDLEVTSFRYSPKKNKIKINKNISEIGNTIFHFVKINLDKEIKKVLQKLKINFLFYGTARFANVLHLLVGVS